MKERHHGLKLAICVFLTQLCHSFGQQADAKLVALRVENLKPLVSYRDKIARVEPGVDVHMRLFGFRMSNVDSVLYTSSRSRCILEPDLPPIEGSFDQQNNEQLTVVVNFPQAHKQYFLCLKFKDPSSPAASLPIEKIGNRSASLVRRSNENPALEDEFSFVGNKSEPEVGVPQPDYVFQGTENYRTIAVMERTREHYLPVPLQAIIIVLLLCLSGLFSGLNLGLMALDQTELKIILNSGSKRERVYAEKIIPIRKSGNYLLCTLLLGNVIVNSSVSILLDDLTSGLIALIGSSLGIVILGEIIPQSICSRYGLAVGARTIWITKMFMFLTAPLSWPISKILDKILGEEAGHVYNRERLLELIRLSKETPGGELGTCQEVQIVTGALEFSQKQVKDIMTEIRDVYMLPATALLDPKTISEIVKSGYTRIPVYQDSKDNIITLLNVKDLALLDPDDRIPVRAVCDFYRHPVRFVLEDTPLNVMLDEFKRGHYHMAFVQRINSEGPGDPIYENMGLVTLEDIIEEIIQSEIVDETDIITDNRRRTRRKETQCKDLSWLTDTSSRFNISPQLALATYQYLNTTMEPFRLSNVSEHVLQRMIQQNVAESKAPESDMPAKFLYVRDKPADNFILILEGRVEVTAGHENFVFEAGPFFYFGKQAVEKMLMIAQSGHANEKEADACKRAMFIPDFSVRITHDVIYLNVKAETYLNAYRTTMIERKKTPGELGFEDGTKSTASLSKATGNILSVNLSHAASVASCKSSPSTISKTAEILSPVLPNSPTLSKKIGASTPCMKLSVESPDPMVDKLQELIDTSTSCAASSASPGSALIEQSAADAQTSIASGGLESNQQDGSPLRGDDEDDSQLPLLNVDSPSDASFHGPSNKCSLISHPPHRTSPQTSSPKRVAFYENGDAVIVTSNGSHHPPNHVTNAAADDNTQNSIARKNSVSFDVDF